MMGWRERGQGQFFYAFDLDKVAPADHLVRQIDGVLDLDWRVWGRIDMKRFAPLIHYLRRRKEHLQRAAIEKILVKSKDRFTRTGVGLGHAVLSGSRLAKSGGRPWTGRRLRRKANRDRNLN